MYHWIAAIAPKRYNSLLSFATGWCTVFGCEDHQTPRKVAWVLIDFRDFHNCVDKLDLRYDRHGFDCTIPRGSGNPTLDDLRCLPDFEYLHLGNRHVWK